MNDISFAEHFLLVKVFSFRNLASLIKLNNCNMLRQKKKKEFTLK